MFLEIHRDGCGNERQIGIRAKRILRLIFPVLDVIDTLPMETTMQVGVQLLGMVRVRAIMVVP